MPMVANRRSGVQSPLTSPPLSSPGAVPQIGGVKSGGPMPVSAPNPLTSFSPDALLQNYNTAQNQAKNANETRYNDILGGYGDLGAKAGSAYGALSGSLLNSYGTNANNNIQGYQDRYGRNMDYLNNAGVQQKADVNTAYNAQNASQQQQLASQGLAGTTIAPTMQNGNEQQRQAQLQRVDQQTQQQRLATDSALSGDTLQAQNNANQTMTNLGSQLGQAGIGAQLGIGQNQLNFQERRNDAYPDLNSLTNTMTNLGRYGGAGGAGLGGAPVAPKGNSYSAPPPTVAGMAYRPGRDPNRIVGNLSAGGGGF